METTPGKRIQMFREYKGYKKAAPFAEAAGLKPATLSSIETDRTSPSFDSIAAISAAFPDLSLDWLLFGTGSMLRGKELTPKSETRPSTEPTTPPNADLAYWQRLAEERGRLAEERGQQLEEARERERIAREREDRMWKQIESFPTGSLDAAPIMIPACAERVVVSGFLNAYQIEQRMVDHVQALAKDGLHLWIDYSDSATPNKEREVKAA